MLKAKSIARNFAVIAGGLLMANCAFGTASFTDDTSDSHQTKDVINAGVIDSTTVDRSVKSPGHTEETHVTTIAPSPVVGAILNPFPYRGPGFVYSSEALAASGGFVRRGNNGQLIECSLAPAYGFSTAGQRCRNAPAPR